MGSTGGIAGTVSGGTEVDLVSMGQSEDEDMEISLLNATGLTAADLGR